MSQQLILYMNNFMAESTSYYDNVTLSIVPEPSPVVLASIGCVGLLVCGRLRRRPRVTG